MLHLSEHIINGAVAEYVVRDDDLRRVATFNASREGCTAAHELVTRHNATDVAITMAAAGWCQADIRRRVSNDFTLGWMSADVIATYAVAYDNEVRRLRCGEHVA